jgi:hypothetical protein
MARSQLVEDFRSEPEGTADLVFTQTLFGSGYAGLGVLRLETLLEEVA